MALTMVQMDAQSWEKENTKRWSILASLIYLRILQKKREKKKNTKTKKLNTEFVTLHGW